MIPGNQQNNDYDPWSLLIGEDVKGPEASHVEVEEKHKEDEEQLRQEKEDALAATQSAKKALEKEQNKKHQEEQRLKREREDALAAAKELEEAKHRIEELEASLRVKSEQAPKEQASGAAPKSELSDPNKAGKPAAEKQDDAKQSHNKVTINRSLFNK